MPRFAPGILDPGDRTTSNVDGGDEGPDRRSRRRGAEQILLYNVINRYNRNSLGVFWGFFIKYKKGKISITAVT